MCVKVVELDNVGESKDRGGYVDVLGMSVEVG